MSDIPPPPPYEGHIPPPPPALPQYAAPTASPEQIWRDPAGPYAGFWLRVGSRLLDGLILGLIAAVCFVPAVVVAATGDWEEEPCTVDLDGNVIDSSYDLIPNATCEVISDETLLAALAVGAVGLVPFVLVYVWYYRKEGRTGLTWGRSATGTRLVDAVTGRPIGGARSFGRAMLGGIFSYALGLNYLWCAWDKRKQTWQDKVITSVVVRDPAR